MSFFWGKRRQFGEESSGGDGVTETDESVMFSRVDPRLLDEKVCVDQLDPYALDAIELDIGDIELVENNVSERPASAPSIREVALREVAEQARKMLDDQRRGS